MSDPLAAEVAKAFMEHYALAAHARDEIGSTETSAAQPIQAALASAATCWAGAILPVLVALTAS
ncbi:VIT1/CCC1 transporter family protein, partial [Neisseria sp. P0015.S002]|uniref:VIT1/CCC1 transporter family protein n=1 Tax=Neisseria sp. P0015.S002 TaxID=3436758 RepID=UPI003F7DB386